MAKKGKEKRNVTSVKDLGFTDPLMIDALKVEDEKEEEVVEEVESCETCQECKVCEEEVQYKTVSYLVCPTCGTKQVAQHGSDVASSWCERCGKCFMVDWKQEQVKI